jgi:hypothetical protein
MKIVQTNTPKKERGGMIQYNHHATEELQSLRSPVHPIQGCVPSL